MTGAGRFSRVRTEITELNTPSLFSVTSVVGLFSGWEDSPPTQPYTQEARGASARRRPFGSGEPLSDVRFCLLLTAYYYYIPPVPFAFPFGLKG
jgi:hypothetical protein